MNKTTPALALAALLSLAPHAFAQGMDHGKTGSGHGDMMAMQNLPPAEGEVRRIDKDSGKITLRHGEIKNMDMPPMTMVFSVRDKAMLDGIAVGDKVEFTAVQDKGQMLVESIKPLKP